MTESTAGESGSREAASTARLSPVDEVMIQYVREGKFDAEIAVRVGMTVGEVKTRLAVICQRVGVGDRGDLAAWEPRDTHLRARERPARDDTARESLASNMSGQPGAAAGGHTHRAPFGALVLGVAAVLLLILFLGAASIRGPERPEVGEGRQPQVSAGAVPTYTSGYGPAQLWYLAIFGAAIGARIAAGESLADVGTLIPAAR